MNRTRYKGSPYLIPLRGKKKFDGAPLAKIARDEAETIYIPNHHNQKPRE